MVLEQLEFYHANSDYIMDGLGKCLGQLHKRSRHSEHRRWKNVSLRADTVIWWSSDL